MFFQNSPKNPRAMMLIGMVCLAVGIILPYVLHPTEQFELKLMHGMRGMLFGVSVVLNLWCIRSMARQRRGDAS